MTKLEQAARAIAKENGDDFDRVPRNKPHWIENQGQFACRYRDINEPYQADYLDMARAAVEALREPSEQMISSAMAPYAYQNDDKMNASFRVAIDGYWRAMHDAILSEKA